MTDVFYAFFSYAAADARLDPSIFNAFSTQLCERVTAQMAEGELRSWRDIEQVRVGETWHPRIIESLRASHILIIMLSPAWLKSKYCREEYHLFEEVERSYGKSELVVPFLFRDPKDELEFMSSIQRATYASLLNRQYRPTPVDALLKTNSNRVNAQLENLSRELKEILSPFRTRNTKAEPQSAIPSETTRLPRHNLPLKSLGEFFIGRDTLMSQLELEMGDRREIALLQGMGGVGKTRLAIEFAWRHAAEHSALLYISAETPEAVTNTLSLLTTTLSLPEKEIAQAASKHEAVVRWLAHNLNWLLIIDNVDDADGAAAVVELLPQLTNGKVIITARYDGFPPNIPMIRLDVLSPDHARDFLIMRTKDRRRLADNDTLLAEEISKELAFLPLALEQAGAFICVQRLSLERYLTYWRDEKSRVRDWFDKTAMGTNRDYGIATAFETSFSRLSFNGRLLLNLIAFLSYKPIPEFLLDIAPIFPDSEIGLLDNESKQSPPRNEDIKFEARAALAELYAYGLAAPTETDGSLEQPSFVVHSLVQDYARSRMEENHANSVAIQTAVWLIQACKLTCQEKRDNRQKNLLSLASHLPVWTKSKKVKNTKLHNELLSYVNILAADTLADIFVKCGHKMEKNEALKILDAIVNNYAVTGFQDSDIASLTQEYNRRLADSN
ncbi:tetratricopeptide repeat protein [Methylocystis echinoides]|uniref:TIR domain-containing protein n=1 Tax=Methylocystis echinoides TaxID=29468 RepID=A0A9W6LST3_9HYPH|nr:toll/interleukin-1 receptor domain-containing protein [Methylocystis echinoides]GLI93801.1 hypothetical protein LMG27198_27930 [Methylocystis echinoides]